MLVLLLAGYSRFCMFTAVWQLYFLRIRSYILSLNLKPTPHSLRRGANRHPGIFRHFSAVSYPKVMRLKVMKKKRDGPPSSSELWGPYKWPKIWIIMITCGHNSL